MMNSAEGLRGRLRGGTDLAERLSGIGTDIRFPITERFDERGNGVRRRRPDLAQRQSRIASRAGIPVPEHARQVIGKRACRRPGFAKRMNYGVEAKQFPFRL